MQYLVYFIFLPLFIQSVEGHTRVSSINGQTKCLRETKGPYKENFPTLDPNSPDMECNARGYLPAPYSCPFKAGEEINLLWRHNVTHPNNPHDDIIHRTHKGPCAVYISKTGSGKWAKIYEEGYKNNQWCTERLRRNRGKMTFTLPKELANGKWILRGEIIALHKAREVYSGKDMGAQYYIRCMDIEISGGGGQIPSPSISIPGPAYLSANHPGVHFNLYTQRDYNKYKIPGPPVSTYSGKTSLVQPRG